MANNLLIERIADKINVSKSMANNLLRTYVQFLNDELSNGNEVAVRGFGSFEMVQKAERKIFNPTNKKYTFVPEKKTVKFKPANSLKAFFK